MSRQASPKHQQSGFTLVELMITVAVIAILIGIGFPSFSATLRSSRVTTHANNIIATFSLARTEAIKSSGASGVCPSANGTSCGGAWNSGWIVFDDVNNNGTADAGEVARAIGGNSSLTVTTGGGLVSPILFSSRGLPTTAVPASGVAAFTVQPMDCPTGVDAVRKFFLNATGQIRMAKATCP